MPVESRPLRAMGKVEVGVAVQKTYAPMDIKTVLFKP